MNVEHEINELKRRVGDLEGAVNVLSGQVGKVHPQLVSLEVTAGTRFDRVEDLVGKINGRLDLLNTQLWSLRDDLPLLLTNSGPDKLGHT